MSIAERYSDLLFDLCFSLLPRKSISQSAYKVISKKIKKNQKPDTFEEFERPAVLRTSIHILKKFYIKEKFVARNLDLNLSSETPDQKLKRLNHFLSKLSFKEQTILLLRDKYGLPYKKLPHASKFQKRQFNCFVFKH